MTALVWHRRRRAANWAPHYESADGRWRAEPVAYTVPCDGYVDGHNGCPGNAEHTREGWQLAEWHDGRWVEIDEMFDRLRDAKAAAEGTTR